MHLALRSLSHFRKSSLAVALGAAVASTVLTGALLTGDSVRGSLRDLTLERLGGIDQALVSSRFFREELAVDLNAAPLIVLRGTVVHGESGARAAGVSIYGVDARFAELHGTALPELTGSGLFPPLVLNEPLQRELGVRPGDDVLLSFERPGEIPRETLLGEKESDDVLATRRFTVARVLPERGIGSGLGSFGLAAHQSQPRTAFVALKDLQLSAEQAGEVNALVAREGADVRRHLRLEDLGLRLVPGERHVSLESDEFYLDPAVSKAVGDTSATRIFTNLATGLRVGERLLPYSMVSGISNLDVGDGEILLNRWAADDLQARPGDPVEMSYLVMAPGGGLLERKTTLRLRGVLEMSGLGADRTLTPSFPGIENTEDMSAWDPPFPVDLDVIRPKDEEYWDAYGPAPKAFVSLATARRLWSTRFGDLTAVRVPLQTEETLRRELPRRVPLEPFGLVFQPVKREGLAAAEGSTDFAGLFLAFSFFLILSAVLLVGLLFSLSVERRAGELGLLLAVGYPIRKVRRRLLIEGAVLAGLGSLLGLAGAAGYAWLLMAGLRSWWLPAVGTPHLFLHVHPASLAIGWAASVLTVLLAIAWTVRRLSKLPAPALLAGSTAMPSKGGRLARRLAPGAALVAAVLLALSWKESSPVLWMGIGAALLVSGLSLVSLWLRRPRPARHLTLTGMAARNGAASPGRSLLSVALVACACFVLVTVAANRREAGEGEAEFPLYAESAVPVVVDPAEEAGLQGVTVYSLYTVPGDDISCLNLFRPTRPRLLGVPATLAGFDALKQDLGPEVIPAVADANSATWILKLKIGEELVLESESGHPVRIRLVGLLERSLFQSEVLISEAAMLRHFPGLARKTFFLIDGPPETAQALEESLSRYGFDVSTTAERLASYHAVEDTYLSTFQALGGFGLLLGTLGLGVALLRSLIERRGELATLRAFGFRRSRIAGMVVAENGFLLLLGVAVGTVSGLLAVAPRLISVGGGPLPWASLGVTILAVLLVGLLSCAAAVRSALEAPLLPVLKEER
jgi:putative ABC transport system permease protein